MNNRSGFGKRIASSRRFCQIEATDGSSTASVQLPNRGRHGPGKAGLLGRGATVTNRYERLRMQRRMQRRIRLVVEERRMSLALPPHPRPPEAPVEIPPRAIGRVAVDTA